jgi:hypothetical protein
MIAVCKSRGMCCFNNGENDPNLDSNPNEDGDRQVRERLRAQRRLKNLEEKLLLQKFSSI